MPKIVRLTESDLNRIVRRVLNEQPGIFDIASDPALAGVIFTPEVVNSGCKKDNPTDNKVSQLFTYCNKVTPDYNTAKSKDWNNRLYKAMKGPGTNKNEITKVLNEIQTINQLAAIWKTFKYDNKNLWYWIKDEWFYSWNDFWNELKHEVKFPAKIPECLEYNKNVTNS